MQIRAYPRRTETTIVIPASHKQRDQIMHAVADVLNSAGSHIESDEVRNAIPLDGSEMDQKPLNSSEEN